MANLKQTPFSILDLAPIAEGQPIQESFHHSLQLARQAEQWGYKRFWMAEHHNLEGVASSATAVLLGYIAGNTKTIRVGSGGVMLPNHSPLIIAEQFGTLETLYPGRIDLGLGRAPGSDRATMRAIRHDLSGTERDFSELVQELQYYLAPQQEGQKVKAIPGMGLKIPIWILGSSLYSAQLAAALGLPYSFAGHFAPDEMHEAVELYRHRFEPSKVLDKPYVMIGIQILAADTEEKAQMMATTLYRRFLGIIRNQRTTLQPPIKNMDGLWSPQEEALVRSRLKTAVIGTKENIAAGIQTQIDQTVADELMIVSDAYDFKDRLRSFEIIQSLKK
jgi:luciferase family oxidoreductase group 1